MTKQEKTRKICQLRNEAFNKTLMAVWAVKRDDVNETNERLIKRWKRQVNGARIINAIKWNKYQAQKDTKKITREKAVKRAENQEKNKKAMFYA